jgi:hypothetical protein
MMPTEDQKNKLCRYCAENIPAPAIICPRCRQWLSFWSFRNPALIFCVTLLPLLGFFTVMVNFMEKFMNPRPYYSEFQKSIRILQSKIQWAETSDGARIYVTGIVTNESVVSWRSVEFDTRFYDSKGQLIDAATGYGSFTILPGNDSGFRVIVRPILSSNDYGSFKISVSNAKNARGPF